ncbi:MAG: glycine cleavage system H protein [Lysobacteraceae bacterium]|nr:MAG: glycine cleavage system H protein [Xanthomonadaceae bacterium]
MSEIPSELRFAESHEWARLNDDGTITIGISDHAQSQLGDLVYVELPEVGDEATAGDAIAVVESVKAASDVYSPISGEIVAVNDDLADAPERVNESPYDDGWLYSVQPASEGEYDAMMDSDAYAESLDDE